MKKLVDKQNKETYNNFVRAEVAELADAHGSGPCGSNTLWVRLPSSALNNTPENIKFSGVFAVVYSVQEPL